MFGEGSENDEEMSNNYFHGGGDHKKDSDSNDYDFFKIDKSIYESKMIEFSNHIIGPIRNGSPSILCKKFISLSCDTGNDIKWAETFKKPLENAEGNMRCANKPQRPVL